MQQVRLSFGINLAGGVTVDHVRCPIVEVLKLVRRMRRKME
jgi:Ni,Fe-hydrogenase III large subunit